MSNLIRVDSINHMINEAAAAAPGAVDPRVREILMEELAERGILNVSSSRGKALGSMALTDRLHQSSTDSRPVTLVVMDDGISAESGGELYSPLLVRIPE